MSSPTPTPTTSSPPSTNSTSPTPSATPSAPAPASPSPPAPTTPSPTVSPPPPATPAPVVSSPPPPATPAPVVSSPPPPPTSPAPVSSPPPPSTPSPVSSPPPPPPATTTSPPPKSSPTTPPSPPPPSGSGSVKSPPPPPPKGSGTGKLVPPPPPTTSGGTGLSKDVVMGVVIGGAVVVVVLLGLICFCCLRKKRRSRREDYGSESGFYAPPPPPPRLQKDGYYGQAGHWQQSNPPPAEQHVMQKPPPFPPGASPWGAQPPQRPPTPPLVSPTPPHISSGGSGSNYSGSEGNLAPLSPAMSLGLSKSTFSYEELAMATDGFSDINLLGQGGFGYVHKGVLPNGKEVAVKALKAGSGQGEREFQAEVDIISRVHHKHLVSLVGYCIAGSQRMLVYEFVPNFTLEFHLHGKGNPTMDWQTRLKIALGAAKGLAYLHEDCHPRIIHRDIKASNILLDYNFEAMVSDFGLAKLSSDANTHISTRVMGTFGYLAPEYASSGKLTDKSDVFSFGIVLLELITGRRPIASPTDDSLIDWARPILARPLEDEDYVALVDTRLQGNYNHGEMARMVACAASCTRHSAKRRPRMSQIVRALEGHVSLSDLNEGIRPGHSTVYGSFESSDYDNQQYKEDMVKFRKTAFASQEHGSSEYGGTTSEYGLNPSGSSSEGLTSREMEMAKMKKDGRGIGGSREYLS